MGFFNQRNIMLLLLCFLTSSAMAFSWSDLWLRPNQQGQRALQNGEAKKAATLFESPDWQGVANYRAKDYQQAKADFSKQQNAVADYNRGNALAHMGQYQAAIDAYSVALKKQPDFKDAEYNRQLLEKLKQKQKKQQNSNKDKKNNKQEQKNKKNKQNPQQNKNQDQDKSQNQRQQGYDKSQQDKNKKQSEQSQKQQQQKKEVKQTEQAKANPVKAPPEIKDQAVKQWLRQIPDDPGGLLRQKFLRDYQRRQQEAKS